MVSSQARRTRWLWRWRGHTQRQAWGVDRIAPLDIEVQLGACRARCAGARRDATDRRHLSAVRLSAGTHLSAPGRSCDGTAAHVSPLVRRRAAIAVAATAATGSASRPRPLPAMGPNQLWAYDFVHDARPTAKKIRCLTLIDEFTRESLAIDVAGSIRSARVIDAHPPGQRPRCADVSAFGQRPEFISNRILLWLAEAKIETALIDPGKPWQNGDNESFNGKFRDECLSMEWFRSRIEARVLIEIRRRHTVVRPHSSLQYRTPTEFRRHHKSTPPGAILR